MTTAQKTRLDEHRALVELGRRILVAGPGFEVLTLDELRAVRAAYIEKILKLRLSEGYRKDPRSAKGKPVHDEISLCEKLLHHHVEPRLAKKAGEQLQELVGKILADSIPGGKPE